MLGWEKELLGLYVTGRPADKYREALEAANTWNIRELKENETGMHDRPGRSRWRGRHHAQDSDQEQRHDVRGASGRLARIGRDD